MFCFSLCIPLCFIIFFRTLLNPCAGLRYENYRADLEHLDRLKFLKLPSLCDFIASFSESLFRKISSNEMHFFFSRIHRHIITLDWRLLLNALLHSVFPNSLHNSWRNDSCIQWWCIFALLYRWEGSLQMKLSSISSMIRVKSSKLASQSSIFGLQS